MKLSTPVLNVRRSTDFSIQRLEADDGTMPFCSSIFTSWFDLADAKKIQVFLSDKRPKDLDYIEVSFIGEGLSEKNGILTDLKARFNNQKEWRYTGSLYSLDELVCGKGLRQLKIYFAWVEIVE